MGQDGLAAYKKILPELFNSIVLAIGSQVMLIVLERSLWKTINKYPEASEIHFSEEGISIDGLDGLENDKATLIVQSFMMSIIDTLSRLVGIQVAEKLTEKLLSE